MTKYPIVLIHKGNTSYLPVSILHNLKQNPQTEIILLGDRENQLYKNLLSHYNLSDYFEKAEQLAGNYIHLSSNGREFELICIQRWFALLEFMKEKKLEKCIFLDSDILSYWDLNTLWNYTENAGMTMVGISAHTNFVSDIKVLEEFCNFVITCYQERKDWLQKIYTEQFLEGSPGGISDMTFFIEFRKLYPEKVRNLESPAEGLFDITLDYNQGLLMEGKIKKVLFHKEGVFVTDKTSQKEIPVFTLHFQGSSKKYIKKFSLLDWKGTFLRYGLLLNLYLQKIKQKLPL